MNRTIGIYGIYDKHEKTWILDCFDDTRDFATLKDARAYLVGAYNSPRYEVGLLAPVRTSHWIKDLWPCKRVCKLLGFTCVADFDITPESIDAIGMEILTVIEAHESKFFQGRCETLNIGLYDGGKDIRVWVVNPV